jgi:hypothetical protein
MTPKNSKTAATRYCTCTYIHNKTDNNLCGYCGNTLTTTTPTPQKEDKDYEQLALLFHSTYEKLAPEFGYQTNDGTKVFHKDSANGKLMIVTCKVVFDSAMKEKDEERVIQGKMYEDCLIERDGKIVLLKEEVAKQSAEVTKLQLEIEKLRKALEKVKDTFDMLSLNGKDIYKIVVEALNKPKE